ncbi:MAG: NAD(P)/FAD-dependent oxidoreductase [Oleispira sp.]|nr:NAD(P)/FAD-dependent oxidoreductase [Oleispira sp.]
MSTDIDYEVVIIGTGFAGIGMAIKLQQAGIHSFKLIERSDEVGGTWRDNTYPGCECDVQSHLYSFSFEPKTDWSKKYSSWNEIRDYIIAVTDKHNIRKKIQFNTRLDGASFDQTNGTWLVKLSDGSKPRARFVITAGGPLSNPAIPEIVGKETFKGSLFHSASWDHSIDLKGKKIAVIGTGASAIQFVPRIAEEAASIELFQRSAPWVLPKPDRKIYGLEKFLYKNLPGWRLAHRATLYWANEISLRGFLKEKSFIRSFAEWGATKHIHHHIKDEALRTKLTPNFRFGCKRALLSNEYYPALARENVEVIDTGIERITETGIVDKNGKAHDVDIIIWGTGFKVDEPLLGIDIAGIDGQDLNAVWKDNGFESYYGTTVAGFPNAFILAGPNTGIGHTSLVVMIEAQYNYVMDAIAKIQQQDIKYIDVKDTVQTQFCQSMQDKMVGTAWTSGCNSWYLSASGQNFTLWPDVTYLYIRQTKQINLADYNIVSIDEAEMTDSILAAS